MVKIVTHPQIDVGSTFDLPTITGQPMSDVKWVVFDDNDCEELLRGDSSRCNSVSSCDSDDQPTKGHKEIH